jgi:hypothetical protein
MVPYAEELSLNKSRRRSSTLRRNEIQNHDTGHHGLHGWFVIRKFYHHIMRFLHPRNQLLLLMVPLSRLQLLLRQTSRYQTIPNYYLHLRPPTSGHSYVLQLKRLNQSHNFAPAPQNKVRWRNQKSTGLSKI